MAGVTWRQHRFALVGAVTFLGALAVYLWIAGLPAHHAYNAAVACHPVSSAVCQGLDNTLDGRENFLSNGYILQVLPVLIGAFVGAPVLARELETGTFRFAWTQGFGRWRWAVAKLVGLAVVVTAAAGAFGALLTWYYQPFVSDNEFLGLPMTSPFAPTLFDLRGVGFPAWTLAAFAIGVLAGMLIRRVVPAIVATLVVYAGLAFAAAGFLREHYLTPVLRSDYANVPYNAWTVSQWWTKDGRFAFGNYPPANILNLCSPSPGGKGGPAEGWGPCLVQHGYTQWTSYQPASRFWPFQWIEGGWLLALSALLIAAAIYLVRRRAA
jgi:ABC-2 family transporter protein